jgi:hypothetical protein
MWVRLRKVEVVKRANGGSIQLKKLSSVNVVHPAMCEVTRVLQAHQRRQQAATVAAATAAAVAAQGGAAAGGGATSGATTATAAAATTAVCGEPLHSLKAVMHAPAVAAAAVAAAAQCEQRWVRVQLRAHSPADAAAFVQPLVVQNTRSDWVQTGYLYTLQVAKADDVCDVIISHQVRGMHIYVYICIYIVYI